MTPKLQETDFPYDGSAQAQLRFLLNYAVLAPSSHNSQPWLWEIEGDEVVLRADYSRALSSIDPDGREVIMSCGAALQHLCLAIRAFGYAAILRTLPTPSEPHMLARVRLAASRPASADDRTLFRSITERHTHRGEFEERQLPVDLLRILQDDAEQEGASLYLAIAPEEKSEIAELIQRGNLVQNRDPAMRRDLADWIAPKGKRSDGIPSQALGISDFASHFAPIAQRYLDRGDYLAQKDRALAEAAPVLAVLGTISEGPQAWLSAGQALGRILLRARSQGVWASFFSQPIQVDDAWFQLRHLVGVHSFPQLVLRLGYAQPVAATPRRAVSEVVTTH